MPQVGVVTRHDDFHAHVVQRLLEDQGTACFLLFADSLSCVGGLSWTSAWPTPSQDARGSLRDSRGRRVVVGDLDVVWWRRLTGEPRIPVPLSGDDVRELVANDCQAALYGLLLTDFGGTWISHPEATRTACNKLLQLKVAQQAGLRVPKTLVSQEPDRVRAFCADSGGQVIVKPVAGVQNTPLMTGLVRPDVLRDDAIRVCPATYQELIPGTLHLRISCFGDDLFPVLLETETLDWRYPLDARASPFDLDRTTARRIRHVLARLGLRMGMVDMKLDEAGTPVWLEVNPQGQFMFLEGMCGSLSLSRSFGAFLIAEAEVAFRRRVSSAA